MNNINYFFDFINEAKKQDPLTLFKKDVENIIDDMFLQAKKPKYEYDDDGYPKSVEFEVVYNDWFCDYDEELKNEFTEGVLKKREYEPSLVFDSKRQEGNDKNVNKNKYFIKFKIKKVKVDEKAIEKSKEKKRSEHFEKDSDEQLLKKLRSKRVSDANKEKIMDILKDRGVDYKNPFEEEDEYDMTEEEMMKKAEMAARRYKKNEDDYDISEEETMRKSARKYKNNNRKNKKNESVSYYDYEDDVYLMAEESSSFREFKDKVKDKYPELFEDDIHDVIYWLIRIYKKSTKNQEVTERKKSCGCGKNKNMNTDCKKCGEDCSCDDNEELDDEQEENKTGCVKCKENLNEGVGGKVLKFLNKSEYDKAVEYVVDRCEKCTKEEIKDILKDFFYSKITKRQLKDSKMLDSLIEEIYKDVKKIIEKEEKFGSKRWLKKYGISIKEEEKEEPSLNNLINEAIRIKKFDEIKEEKLEDLISKVDENFDNDAIDEEYVKQHANIIYDIFEKCSDIYGIDEEDIDIAYEDLIYVFYVDDEGQFDLLGQHIIEDFDVDITPIEKIISYFAMKNDAFENQIHLSLSDDKLYVYLIDTNYEAKELMVYDLK